MAVNKKYHKILMGHIGVDSGLVWIGDPCYIMSNKYDRKKGFDYYKACEELGDKVWNSFNYELGHEGLGILTNTYDEDGTYPVYALVEEKGGRPVQILIDFSQDVDEMQI